MKNAVGPVLRMSEDIEAILAAIQDDNPGTAIEVIDRGAYVRIQAEQHMKVTRCLDRAAHRARVRNAAA